MIKVTWPGWGSNSRPLEPQSVLTFLLHVASCRRKQWKDLQGVPQSKIEASVKIRCSHLYCQLKQHGWNSGANWWFPRKQGLLFWVTLTPVVSYIAKSGAVARSDASGWGAKCAGSILTSGNILSRRFSMAIFSLPLIQEGQVTECALSTCKLPKLCLILVRTW